MKRLVALVLTVMMILGLMPAVAMAKKNTQMNDNVPVWNEETVRQYALDYIEGKSMHRLWEYYDLQIRRYMPMSTYEAMLIELEWLTGGFIELGTYRSFEEAEHKTKTHVLHLCMEQQDLDMYFTHKDKENDWEIMAVEFVPADKQAISDGRDMLVGEDGAKTSAEQKYVESDITVGNAPYELKGVLTLPKDMDAQSKLPACVLVHDQGPLDHDGTIGQTTFLKDLAHALAEMGIASIRYDKRTYTYGETDDMTVWEEVVEDALSAGKLLSEHPSVDDTRLVVVGHGFGAMLTPRIASQANGLFTAMMMIGGMPTTLLTQMVEDPEATASLTVEGYSALKETAAKLVDMPEETARELSIFGRSGYYFWEMEQYDPIKLIKKLKLPTHIVQGRADPLVSENQGWRAYSEAIGDGITYVSFKSFRGLNHLLMNDLTVNGAGKPEYSIAATLDKQAGRNLSQWILNLYMDVKNEE